MCGVKLRAVTLGLDLPTPADPTEPLRRAASFLGGARAAFGAAGIDVQTVRVAGQALDEVCARLSVADLQAAAGDVSEAELAGVFLDVAALSVALDGKPLTVRLMPVPGAVAGSTTAFSFAYFANTRVLPGPAGGAAGILARGGCG